MGAQTRYTRSSVANIKRFGKKLIKLAEKTPKSKLNLVKNGERKKKRLLDTQQTLSINTNNNHKKPRPKTIR